MPWHSERCEKHHREAIDAKTRDQTAFNVFVHTVFLSSVFTTARLAQSVERKALNLVVVGSSPTVGVSSSQACQSPTYVTFEVELP